MFGDYFVSSSQGNVVRPFGPATIQMRTWESCQSLARHHLLPKLLRDADAEFKDIRRCIVLGVRTSTGGEVHGLPLKYMSKEQIKAECESQNSPLLIDMYPDIIRLRQALHEVRKDPKAFEIKERRHIAAFNKIGDAISMNANVFTGIADDNVGGASVDLLNKSKSEPAMPTEITAIERDLVKAQKEVDDNIKGLTGDDIPPVKTIVTTGGVDVEVTGGVVDAEDFEL